MKKIVYIIMLIFGLSTVSTAQYYQGMREDQKRWERGVFGLGFVSDEQYYGLSTSRTLLDYDSYLLPGMPGHGFLEDQGAPLGSGTLLLLGLGAAYFIQKRKKELR